MFGFVARGVFWLQFEPFPGTSLDRKKPEHQVVEQDDDPGDPLVAEEDIKTVLDRNIFDSVTGSVLHSPLSAREQAPQETGKLDVKDLIRCPGSEEIIVEATISDEGNAGGSFAAINQDGIRSQVVIGDEVLSRKVVAITWRYIILQGTSDVCYLDLF